MRPLGAAGPIERKRRRPDGAAGRAGSGLTGALAWAAPLIGRNDARTQRAVASRWTSRKRAAGMRALRTGGDEWTIVRWQIAYCTMTARTMSPFRSPASRPGPGA